jgi:hypothetical protein
MMRALDMRPGHIVWQQGNGKRVEAVEKLPDFEAFYGKQKCVRILFTDGTALTTSDTYHEVNVVLADSGQVVCAAPSAPMQSDGGDR